MRARSSRSTAAVKRSKDKRYHLLTLVVLQGAEISLAGKYIVLNCNLLVSVAGQDLLIMKLKRNIHLFLTTARNTVLVFDLEINKGSRTFLSI